MGAMIKDSTTLDILVQLNKRFDADALHEMIVLQKEFGVFSSRHTLHHSFALLSIVPVEWSERQRWYKFLEHLKTYPSDMPNVNGHDRIVKAFKDGLEADNPLPISIRCHSAADEPKVTVSQGRPAVFSLDTHTIVSIPTTPRREARRQAAETAKKRRVAKTKK